MSGIAKNLERKLLELIHKGEWPTKYSIIDKKVKMQVFLQRKELALTSVRGIKFIKNSKNYKSHLSKLKETASKRISSLVWKIVAIDVSSRTKGSVIPGIDCINFQPIPIQCKVNTEALKQLHSKINKFKNDLLLFKGHIDQVIYRKKTLMTSIDKKRY